MVATAQRRTQRRPVKKSAKKKQKPVHSLRKGQSVRVKGTKKKRGGTYLHDGTKKGTIVVRRKQTHPKRLSKKTLEELSLLNSQRNIIQTRLKELERKYNPFTPYRTEEEHQANQKKLAAQSRRLWAQRDEIAQKIKRLTTQPTQVTLIKVEKIPLSDVAPPKKKTVHKFRRVPKIERKKARRKSLIKAAKKKTDSLGGRIKFLRSKGIRPTTKERESLK